MDTAILAINCCLKIRQKDNHELVFVDFHTRIGSVITIIWILKYCFLVLKCAVVYAFK
jgi:hypothetical protein